MKALDAIRIALEVQRYGHEAPERDEGFSTRTPRAMGRQSRDVDRRASGRRGHATQRRWATERK